MSGPTHLSTVNKVYTQWLNTHQPDSVRSHPHGVRIWTSSFAVSKFSVLSCSSSSPASNTTIRDAQEGTIATVSTPSKLLTTMSDPIQSHVVVQLQKKIEKFEKVTCFTLFVHASLNEQNNTFDRMLWNRRFMSGTSESVEIISFGWVLLVRQLFESAPLTRP